ncbi:hypothetical protein BDK51DRAFT_32334, partial [Blyttiomyces helicus]
MSQSELTPDPHHALDAFELELDQNTQDSAAAAVTFHDSSADPLSDPFAASLDSTDILLGAPPPPPLPAVDPLLFSQPAPDPFSTVLAGSDPFAPTLPRAGSTGFDEVIAAMPEPEDGRGTRGMLSTSGSLVDMQRLGAQVPAFPASGLAGGADFFSAAAAGSTPRVAISSFPDSAADPFALPPGASIPASDPFAALASAPARDPFAALSTASDPFAAFAAAPASSQPSMTLTTPPPPRDTLITPPPPISPIGPVFGDTSVTPSQPP